MSFGLYFIDYEKWNPLNVNIMLKKKYCLQLFMPLKHVGITIMVIVSLL